MLKRKIKIILIGLFSLMFIGLLYSLFSSKSEIIADESLAIEEPAMPGIELQLERAANEDKQRLSSMIDSQVDPSLKSELVDQSASSDQEGVDVAPESSQIADNDPLSANLPEQLADSSADQMVVDPNNAITDAGNTASVTPKTTPTKVVPAEVDPSVNPFSHYDNPPTEVVDQKATDSDVDIIPDTAEFLDLNLSEADAKPSDTVLLEGDQLILDDINKSLRNFKSIIPEVSENEGAGVADKSSSEQTGAIVSKYEEEGPLEDNQTASVSSSIQPSVFSLPPVDQELMEGDGEISQQYRLTMSKLISINNKLRAADEENTVLQSQFNMVVSQNLKLAQIIRDIDFQIKAYTSTN